MKHNKKKLLIIVDELMQCFLKLGCKSINVDFDIEGSECVIKITGKYNPKHREHVEKLESNLNCGRNIELEECYWSIAGCAEINQGSELYVVGSMLDKCTVLYDDENIEVVAYRNA